MEAAFYEWLIEELPEQEKADFLQILELLYLRSKTESRNGFPHVTKRLKDEGGQAEHPRDRKRFPAGRRTEHGGGFSEN